MKCSNDNCSGTFHWLDVPDSSIAVDIKCDTCPYHSSLAGEVFDMCGCVGNGPMNTIMALLNEIADTRYYCKDPDLATMLMLIMLDGKDLIEHGISIRGSFITQKGIDLLQFWNSRPTWRRNQEI